jgi:hypothetical protein
MEALHQGGTGTVNLQQPEEACQCDSIINGRLFQGGQVSVDLHNNIGSQKHINVIY